MDRIRRVGNSAILSELAKKGIKEGGDKEGMESMNVMPDTVVGKREETMRVSVSDWREWESVNCSVTELVIAAKCCNEKEVKEVDLGRFVSLKVFEVGDECYRFVKEVRMIGLNQLERVVIGENSFMKDTRVWSKFTINPDRHFYLKNCERVRELKMGCQSFNYFSVCEIENVPSLEVIEMGDLNGASGNFYYASLELKSDCERMK